MTSRERMLTALNNARPDRLPCQVHGWMPYYLQHYLGGMDWWQAYEKFDMDFAIYARFRRKTTLDAAATGFAKATPVERGCRPPVSPQTGDVIRPMESANPLAPGNRMARVWLAARPPPAPYLAFDAPGRAEPPDPPPAAIP